MQKIFVTYKILCSFLVLLNILPNSWAYTILIDPGHGGEDMGATTKINSRSIKKEIYEKDINLEYAQRLYRHLKKYFTVYLSRSVDRSISLMERALVAEKIKADLMISIHSNSAPDRSSRGHEIYYLDNHNDIAVKKVENVENHEKINPWNVPDPTVQQILLDLVIQKTVAQSQQLAQFVHVAVNSKMTKKYMLQNRGIRPGLFFILALSKRPSILIELGFLSHPQEAQKLIQDQFQEDYAMAIADGIRQFVQFRQGHAITMSAPQ